MDKQKV